MGTGLDDRRATVSLLFAESLLASERWDGGGGEPDRRASAYHLDFGGDAEGRGNGSQSSPAAAAAASGVTLLQTAAHAVAPFLQPRAADDELRRHAAELNPFLLSMLPLPNEPLTPAQASRLRLVLSSSEYSEAARSFLSIRLLVLSNTSPLRQLLHAGSTRVLDGTTSEDLAFLTLYLTPPAFASPGSDTSTALIRAGVCEFARFSLGAPVDTGRHPTPLLRMTVRLVAALARHPAFLVEGLAGPLAAVFPLLRCRDGLLPIAYAARRTANGSAGGCGGGGAGGPPQQRSVAIDCPASGGGGGGGVSEVVPQPQRGGGGGGSELDPQPQRTVTIDCPTSASELDPQQQRSATIDRPASGGGGVSELGPQQSATIDCPRSGGGGGGVSPAAFEEEVAACLLAVSRARDFPELHIPLQAASRLAEMLRSATADGALVTTVALLCDALVQASVLRESVLRGVGLPAAYRAAAQRKGFTAVLTEDQQDSFWLCYWNCVFACANVDDFVAHGGADHALQAVTPLLAPSPDHPSPVTFLTTSFPAADDPESPSVLPMFGSPASPVILGTRPPRGRATFDGAAPTTPTLLGSNLRDPESPTVFGSPASPTILGTRPSPRGKANFVDGAAPVTPTLLGLNLGGRAPGSFFADGLAAPQTSPPGLGGRVQAADEPGGGMSLRFDGTDELAGPATPTWGGSPADGAGRRRVDRKQASRLNSALSARGPPGGGTGGPAKGASTPPGAGGKKAGAAAPAPLDALERSGGDVASAVFLLALAMLERVVRSCPARARALAEGRGLARGVLAALADASEDADPFVVASMAKLLRAVAGYPWGARLCVEWPRFSELSIASFDVSFARCLTGIAWHGDALRRWNHQPPLSLSASERRHSRSLPSSSNAYDLLHSSRRSDRSDLLPFYAAESTGIPWHNFLTLLAHCLGLGATAAVEALCEFLATVRAVLPHCDPASGHSPFNDPLDAGLAASLVATRGPYARAFAGTCEQSRRFPLDWPWVVVRLEVDDGSGRQAVAVEEAEEARGLHAQWAAGVGSDYRTVEARCQARQREMQAEAASRDFTALQKERKARYPVELHAALDVAHSYEAVWYFLNARGASLAAAANGMASAAVASFSYDVDHASRLTFVTDAHIQLERDLLALRRASADKIEKMRQDENEQKTLLPPCQQDLTREADATAATLLSTRWLLAINPAGVPNGVHNTLAKAESVARFDAEAKEQIGFDYLRVCWSGTAEKAMNESLSEVATELADRCLSEKAHVVEPREAHAFRALARQAAADKKRALAGVSGAAKVRAVEAEVAAALARLEKRKGDVQFRHDREAREARGNAELLELAECHRDEGAAAARLRAREEQILLGRIRQAEAERELSASKWEWAVAESQRAEAAVSAFRSGLEDLVDRSFRKRTAEHTDHAARESAAWLAVTKVAKAAYGDDPEGTIRRLAEQKARAAAAAAHRRLAHGAELHTARAVCDEQERAFHSARDAGCACVFAAAAAAPPPGGRPPPRAPQGHPLAGPLAEYIRSLHSFRSLLQTAAGMVASGKPVRPGTAGRRQSLPRPPAHPAHALAHWHAKARVHLLPPRPAPAAAEGTGFEGCAAERDKTEVEALAKLLDGARLAVCAAGDAFFAAAEGAAADGVQRAGMVERAQLYALEGVARGLRARALDRLVSEGLVGVVVSERGQGVDFWVTRCSAVALWRSCLRLLALQACSEREIAGRCARYAGEILSQLSTDALLACATRCDPGETAAILAPVSLLTGDHHTPASILRAYIDGVLARLSAPRSPHTAQCCLLHQLRSIASACAPHPADAPLARQAAELEILQLWQKTEACAAAARGQAALQLLSNAAAAGGDRPAFAARLDAVVFGAAPTPGTTGPPGRAEGCGHRDSGWGSLYESGYLLGTLGVPSGELMERHVKADMFDTGKAFASDVRRNAGAFATRAIRLHKLQGEVATALPALVDGPVADLSVPWDWSVASGREKRLASLRTQFGNALSRAFAAPGKTLEDSVASFARSVAAAVTRVFPTAPGWPRGGGGCGPLEDQKTAADEGFPRGSSTGPEHPLGGIELDGAGPSVRGEVSAPAPRPWADLCCEGRLLTALPALPRGGPGTEGAAALRWLAVWHGHFLRVGAPPLAVHWSRLHSAWTAWCRAAFAAVLSTAWDAGAALPPVPACALPLVNGGHATLLQTPGGPTPDGQCCPNPSHRNPSVLACREAGQNASFDRRLPPHSLLTHLEFGGAGVFDPASLAVHCAMAAGAALSDAMQRGDLPTGLAEKERRGVVLGVLERLEAAGVEATEGGLCALIDRGMAEQALHRELAPLFERPAPAPERLAAYQNQGAAAVPHATRLCLRSLAASLQQRHHLLAHHFVRARSLRRPAWTPPHPSPSDTPSLEAAGVPVGYQLLALRFDGYLQAVDARASRPYSGVDDASAAYDPTFAPPGPLPEYPAPGEHPGWVDPSVAMPLEARFRQSIRAAERAVRRRLVVPSWNAGLERLLLAAEDGEAQRRLRITCSEVECGTAVLAEVVLRGIRCAAVQHKALHDIREAAGTLRECEVHSWLAGERVRIVGSAAAVLWSRRLQLVNPEDAEGKALLAECARARKFRRAALGEAWLRRPRELLAAAAANAARCARAWLHPAFAGLRLLLDVHEPRERLRLVAECNAEFAASFASCCTEPPSRKEDGRRENAAGNAAEASATAGGVSADWDSSTAESTPDEKVDGNAKEDVSAEATRLGSSAENELRGEVDGNSEEDNSAAAGLLETSTGERAPHEKVDGNAKEDISAEATRLGSSAENELRGEVDGNTEGDNSAAAGLLDTSTESVPREKLDDNTKVAEFDTKDDKRAGLLDSSAENELSDTVHTNARETESGKKNDKSAEAGSHSSAGNELLEKVDSNTKEAETSKKGDISVEAGHVGYSNTERGSLGSSAESELHNRREADTNVEPAAELHERVGISPLPGDTMPVQSADTDEPRNMPARVSTDNNSSGADQVCRAAPESAGRTKHPSLLTGSDASSCPGEEVRGRVSSESNRPESAGDKPRPPKTSPSVTDRTDTSTGPPVKGKLDGIGNRPGSAEHASSTTSSTRRQSAGDASRPPTKSRSGADGTGPPVDGFRGNLDVKGCRPGSSGHASATSSGPPGTNSKRPESAGRAPRPPRRPSGAGGASAAQPRVDGFRGKLDGKRGRPDSAGIASAASSGGGKRPESAGCAGRPPNTAAASAAGGSARARTDSAASRREGGGGPEPSVSSKSAPSSSWPATPSFTVGSPLAATGVFTGLASDSGSSGSTSLGDAFFDDLGSDDTDTLSAVSFADPVQRERGAASSSQHGGDVHAKTTDALRIQPNPALSEAVAHVRPLAKLKVNAPQVQAKAIAKVQAPPNNTTFSGKVTQTLPQTPPAKAKRPRKASFEGRKPTARPTIARSVPFPSRPPARLQRRTPQKEQAAAKCPRIRSIPSPKRKSCPEKSDADRLETVGPWVKNKQTALRMITQLWSGAKAEQAVAARPRNRSKPSLCRKSCPAKSVAVQLETVGPWVKNVKQTTLRIITQLGSGAWAEQAAVERPRNRSKPSLKRKSCPAKSVADRLETGGGKRHVGSVHTESQKGNAPGGAGAARPSGGIVALPEFRRGSGQSEPAADGVRGLAGSCSLRDFGSLSVPRIEWGASGIGSDEEGPARRVSRGRPSGGAVRLEQIVPPPTCPKESASGNLGFGSSSGSIVGRQTDSNEPGHPSVGAVRLEQIARDLSSQRESASQSRGNLDFGSFSGSIVGRQADGNEPGHPSGGAVRLGQIAPQPLSSRRESASQPRGNLVSGAFSGEASAAAALVAEVELSGRVEAAAAVGTGGVGGGLFESLLAACRDVADAVDTGRGWPDAEGVWPVAFEAAGEGRGRLKVAFLEAASRAWLCHCRWPGQKLGADPPIQNPRLLSLASAQRILLRTRAFRSLPYASKDSVLRALAASLFTAATSPLPALLPPLPLPAQTPAAPTACGSPGSRGLRAHGDALHETPDFHGDGQCARTEGDSHPETVDPDEKEKSARAKESSCPDFHEVGRSMHTLPEADPDEKEKIVRANENAHPETPDSHGVGRSTHTLPEAADPGNDKEKSARAKGATHPETPDSHGAAQSTRAPRCGWRVEHAPVTAADAVLSVPASYLGSAEAAARAALAAGEAAAFDFAIVRAQGTDLYLMALRRCLRRWTAACFDALCRVRVCTAADAEAAAREWVAWAENVAWADVLADEAHSAAVAAAGGGCVPHVLAAQQAEARLAGVDHDASARSLLTAQLSRAAARHAQDHRTICNLKLAWDTASRAAFRSSSESLQRRVDTLSPTSARLPSWHPHFPDLTLSTASAWHLHFPDPTVSATSACPPSRHLHFPDPTVSTTSACPPSWPLHFPDPTVYTTSACPPSRHLHFPDPTVACAGGDLVGLRPCCAETVRFALSERAARARVVDSYFAGLRQAVVGGRVGGWLPAARRAQRAGWERETEEEGLRDQLSQLATLGERLYRRGQSARQPFRLAVADAPSRHDTRRVDPFPGHVQQLRLPSNPHASTLPAIHSRYPQPSAASHRLSITPDVPSRGCSLSTLLPGIPVRFQQTNVSSCSPNFLPSDALARTHPGFLPGISSPGLQQRSTQGGALRLTAFPGAAQGQGGRVADAALTRYTGELVLELLSPRGGQPAAAAPPDPSEWQAVRRLWQRDVRALAALCLARDAVLAGLGEAPVATGCFRCSARLTIPGPGPSEGTSGCPGVHLPGAHPDPSGFAPGLHEEPPRRGGPVSATPAFYTLPGRYALVAAELEAWARAAYRSGGLAACPNPAVHAFLARLSPGAAGGYDVFSDPLQPCCVGGGVRCGVTTCPACLERVAEGGGEDAAACFADPARPLSFPAASGGSAALYVEEQMRAGAPVLERTLAWLAGHRGSHIRRCEPRSSGSFGLAGGEQNIPEPVQVKRGGGSAAPYVEEQMRTAAPVLERTLACLAGHQRSSLGRSEPRSSGSLALAGGKQNISGPGRFKPRGSPADRSRPEKGLLLGWEHALGLREVVERALWGWGRGGVEEGGRGPSPLFGALEQREAAERVCAAVDEEGNGFVLRVVHACLGAGAGAARVSAEERASRSRLARLATARLLTAAAAAGRRWRRASVAATPSFFAHLCGLWAPRRTDAPCVGSASLSDSLGNPARVSRGPHEPDTPCEAGAPRHAGQTPQPPRRSEDQQPAVERASPDQNPGRGAGWAHEQVPPGAVSELGQQATVSTGLPADPFPPPGSPCPGAGLQPQPAPTVPGALPVHACYYPVSHELSGTYARLPVRAGGGEGALSAPAGLLAPAPHCTVHGEPVGRRRLLCAVDPVDFLSVVSDGRAARTLLEEYVVSVVAEHLAVGLAAAEHAAGFDPTNPLAEHDPSTISNYVSNPGVHVGGRAIHSSSSSAVAAAAGVALEVHASDFSAEAAPFAAAGHFLVSLCGAPAPAGGGVGRWRRAARDLAARANLFKRVLLLFAGFDALIRAEAAAFWRIVRLWGEAGWASSQGAARGQQHSQSVDDEDSPHPRTRMDTASHSQRSENGHPLQQDWTHSPMPTHGLQRSQSVDDEDSPRMDTAAHSHAAEKVHRLEQELYSTRVREMLAGAAARGGEGAVWRLAAGPLVGGAVEDSFARVFAAPPPPAAACPAEQQRGWWVPRPDLNQEEKDVPQRSGLSVTDSVTGLPLVEPTPSKASLHQQEKDVPQRSGLSVTDSVTGLPLVRPTLSKASLHQQEKDVPQRSGLSVTDSVAGGGGISKAWSWALPAAAAEVGDLGRAIESCLSDWLGEVRPLHADTPLLSDTSSNECKRTEVAQATRPAEATASRFLTFSSSLKASTDNNVPHDVSSRWAGMYTEQHVTAAAAANARAWLREVETARGGAPPGGCGANAIHASAASLELLPAGVGRGGRWWRLLGGLIGAEGTARGGAPPGGCVANEIHASAASLELLPAGVGRGGRWWRRLDGLIGAEEAARTAVTAAEDGLRSVVEAAHRTVRGLAGVHEQWAAADRGAAAEMRVLGRAEAARAAAGPLSQGFCCDLQRFNAAPHLKRVLKSVLPKLTELLSTLRRLADAHAAGVERFEKSVLPLFFGADEAGAGPRLRVGAGANAGPLEICEGTRRKASGGIAEHRGSDQSRLSEAATRQAEETCQKALSIAEPRNPRKSEEPVEALLLRDEHSGLAVSEVAAAAAATTQGDESRQKALSIAESRNPRKNEQPVEALLLRDEHSRLAVSEVAAAAAAATTQGEESRQKAFDALSQQPTARVRGSNAPLLLRDEHSGLGVSEAAQGEETRQETSTAEPRYPRKGEQLVEADTAALPHACTVHERVERLRLSASEDADFAVLRFGCGASRAAAGFFGRCREKSAKLLDGAACAAAAGLRPLVGHLLRAGGRRPRVSASLGAAGHLALQAQCEAGASAIVRGSYAALRACAHAHRAALLSSLLRCEAAGRGAAAAAEAGLFALISGGARVCRFHVAAAQAHGLAAEHAHAAAALFSRAVANLRREAGRFLAAALSEVSRLVAPARYLVDLKEKCERNGLVKLFQASAPAAILRLPRCAIVVLSVDGDCFEPHVLPVGCTLDAWRRVVVGRRPRPSKTFALVWRGRPLTEALMAEMLRERAPVVNATTAPVERLCAREKATNVGNTNNSHCAAASSPAAE
ncbi:hypothetical protein DIPPA_01290 [Diplonema papillatum]|nr:hypothetical protein DIPPA_01290 [Diplonema papillatum]